MGHYISGIVTRVERLMGFSSETNLHAPSTLINDLGFLPLSDEHLDQLFPVQGDFDESMTYLSAALKERLQELSSNGQVLYIETEYFGGEGAQSAILYEKGNLIFGPLTNDDGAISEALRLMGISAKTNEHDEFESAGFCRYRNNEDWIEEAEQVAASDC